VAAGEAGGNPAEERHAEPHNGSVMAKAVC
jgi:hypothetical protein